MGLADSGVATSHVVIERHHALMASQNRAAEQAAAFAPVAFAPAIASMTVPLRVRHGSGGAASLLASHSRAALLAALRPHVEQALKSTGATAHYSQLLSVYSNLTIASLVIDVPDYVTARTLDALLLRMSSYGP